MKKIMFLLFILNGCTTTTIDEFTAQNIGNLYNGCKDSENLSLDKAKDISYSERFYCLGLVQGTAEAVMYSRKNRMDISPNCRITIKDFYKNAFYNLERGYYPPNTPISNVFYDISYNLCPRIR